MRSAHCLAIRPLRIESVFFLTLFAFASVTIAHAQQPANNQTDERDRGVQLYKQGDTKGAIEALRAAVKHDKDDISAWHYLGLALAQQGKKEDALKAHEKAARTAEELLNYSLDRQAIFRDKAPALPKGQLLEGADSADQYLALSNNSSSKKIQEWNERAEFLRLFGNEDVTGWEIFSGRDVTTKTRILSKPLPAYTEEARRNKVNGTVVLRALFAADGRVHAIRVVVGLPDGLTRVAAMCTQRIKFIPASKDSRPVSQWLEVEYNFNVY